VKLTEKTEGTKRHPVPTISKIKWEWHDESITKGVDEDGNKFSEIREKGKTFYSVYLNEKTYGIGFEACSIESVEDAWEKVHKAVFKEFDLKWQSLSFQLKEIVAWYNRIDCDQVEVDIRIKKKEAA